ncbi:SphA family protein [Desulfonema magnum]|uniref:MetA-pathway of phenol degradation domain-containing protein n=1 Tax=Desulfonema magnum TaxID=45655 RepID=A0A975BWY6_9BACT|nr:transporter [Desulfonema magnum]QTA92853.1 MetA-pathway of phenol degradation domain-containing protein [Desulfonema magnum]
MKKIIGMTLIALGLVGICFGMAFAGAENEYPNGIEGIKAASLPPPGFYYRMYNVLYTADTNTDKDGDELDIDFDLTLFANAHRFIWVSDWKFLGADFASNIIVPIFNIDLEIGALGVDDSQFGLGDIFIEPFVLAWHGSQYDTVFAMGVWAPTGQYDKDEPASPGKDMWTWMGTVGGTYYFDTAKTWSASILARYEIHGEKDELEVTPGDDFHFEWGIGKTLEKFWDIGLTGYCQWQVSDDEDESGAAYGEKDSVYAIGPEVSVFIPSAKLFISLKNQWEFGAEDRSEGNFMCLNFTKIF